jgi:oxygen-independent coproporphyrinogen-3 oxidase
MDADTLAIYLHIPFCRRRCGYCDFFSTEGKLREMPEYVRALAREAAAVGAAGERPRAGSVFFGGGTPSLLNPRQVRILLEKIQRAFRVDPDAEISLEANPGTVDRDSLKGYRAVGVSRLSLGVQSADGDELRILGRIHTFDEAIRAQEDARRAGFDNINLDLIYGLPTQTVTTWERTLRRALELAPEHFSLYALTLERGTALARAVRRGALPAPEEDAAADMYELAEEMLAAAGYRHYEISNWAKDAGCKARSDADATGTTRDSLFPKYACWHNLQYWLNQPYLGFGAGAHGCAGGRRYSVICSVEKYVERMGDERRRRFPLSPAVTSSRIRMRDEEMRETMWLGLRLTEAGVDRERFRRRFGLDFNDKFPNEIASALADGLLEWTAGEQALRLTPWGRLLGNRVFRLFV